MRIEIWSDVVCPWCYIGKRRLEEALESFDHPVEIVWRSFQLDPAAPREATQSVAEHLGQKYRGGTEAGQRMVDQVEAVAAEAGLLFRHSQSKRANTVDAHRLLHLALEEHGPEVQGRLKEALLAAYFTNTENPADHDVLTRIATEAGLPAERVAAVLGSDEYAEDVESDIRRAASLGATGVPFFVIDGKYGIAGAQPAEVFSQVLEKAWDETHPVVMVGGSDSAETCGPDGCAI